MNQNPEARSRDTNARSFRSAQKAGKEAPHEHVADVKKGDMKK
jgi:hypothetical protein